MRDKSRAEQRLWEPFYADPPAEQQADESLLWTKELSDAETLLHELFAHVEGWEERQFLPPGVVHN